MTESKIPLEQVLTTQTAFYTELGRAVAQWSFMELCLAEYFRRFTKMETITARSVFYSGFGFDSRAKMLLNVLARVKAAEPGVNEFLAKAIGKARNWAQSRNMIIHGDVLSIGFEGSKYFGQNIILQGNIPWYADPPDEEVITIENLKIASENFGRLAAVLLLILNWDGKDAEKSPQKFLGLIEKLPILAHCKRLDPTVAAQFLIEPKDIPHGWR